MAAPNRPDEGDFLDRVGRDDLPKVRRPETPDQYRTKWVNRFTAWIMATVVGSSCAILIFAVVKFVVWLVML